MKAHPGSIVFVNGNTDEVVSVDPIDQVPEDLRFVGETPVVRIVSIVHEERRAIYLYGPEHNLLRTMVQSRGR